MKNKKIASVIRQICPEKVEDMEQMREMLEQLDDQQRAYIFGAIQMGLLIGNMKKEKTA